MDKDYNLYREIELCESKIQDLRDMQDNILDNFKSLSKKEATALIIKCENLINKWQSLIKNIKEIDNIK